MKEVSRNFAPSKKKKIENALDLRDIKQKNKKTSSI